MGQVSSWWRKVGMTLAALVLSLITLGPGLDGLLCRDEESLSALAAASAAASATMDDLQVAAIESDAQGHAPAANDKGVCLHGHCHHTTPCVDTACADSEAPVRLAAIDHALASARPPTSEPTFGLKRPPRA